MVIGAMALAVAFAVAAFLGVSDTLPGDALLALRPIEAPAVEASKDSGMHFIHVDGPPTGAARGVQMGLIALLLGGVPAAIFGWALTARRSTAARPWSRAWENVFLAGFVFQLSSVAITAVLLAVVLWFAFDSSTTALGIAVFAVPLFVGVMCGFWGLRCWRVLQHQAQEMPLTIAPN
jgi:hypothetical protein